MNAVSAVAPDDGVAMGLGVLLDYVPHLSVSHAGFHCQQSNNNQKRCGVGSAHCVLLVGRCVSESNSELVTGFLSPINCTVSSG